MTANIKERQNVFFDMEAYLPKKNGYEPSGFLLQAPHTLLGCESHWTGENKTWWWWWGILTLTTTASLPNTVPKATQPWQSFCAVFVFYINSYLFMCVTVMRAHATVYTWRLEDKSCRDLVFFFNHMAHTHP